MSLQIKNCHITAASAKPKPIVLGLGAPAANTSVFIQPTAANISDLSPGNVTLSYSCGFEANPNWPGKYSIISGAGSYIQSNDAFNSRFAMQGYDFTLEIVFTPTGNSRGSYYGGRLIGAERDYVDGWSLELKPPGSFPSNIGFFNPTTYNNILNSNYALVSGQRYHIATTKLGNLYRIFVNGTQVASTTSSTTLVSSALRCLSRGGSYPGTLVGKVEAIRVVKGVSLYNANFVANINAPMYLY